MVLFKVIAILLHCINTFYTIFLSVIHAYCTNIDHTFLAYIHLPKFNSIQQPPFELCKLCLNTAKHSRVLFPKSQCNRCETTLVFFFPNPDADLLISLAWNSFRELIANTPNFSRQMYYDAIRRHLSGVMFSQRPSN